MTQSSVEAGHVVDEFIASMVWNDDTPEEVRSLVAMNVRGFWGWLHRNDMQGCASATNEAMSAVTWLKEVVRDTPVWILSDDVPFGLHWGPDSVRAIRRDDGTTFELTADEKMEWLCSLADSYSSC